jgi:ESS family glutamate:Na+ symporter
MNYYLNDFILVLFVFGLGLGFQRIFPKLFSLLPLSIFSGLLLICFKPLDFVIIGDSSFYSDLLLSFIFGVFPLALNQLNKSFIKKVIPLWKYSLLQYLIQWGGSLLIVILVLKEFFNIGDHFGAYLPSGFAGGHGSAAVVGDLLRRGGIEDALSFTMFCATIGIIFSVLGGLIWTRVYKKKFTLREIKLDKGQIVFKDILLILFSISLSFLIKPFVYEVLKVNIPGFVLAVFVGLLLRQIFGGRDKYTLNQISNYATDFLVIVGIGSIKFEVISRQLSPLLILFAFGLLQAILVYIFLSPRIFNQEDAFEKALFTWGWSIGGLVIGLNLVQSLESNKKEEILDEFAMTYLMLSPCEISLLLLGPWIILNGFGLYLAAFLAILAIIILYDFRKKYLSA